MADFTSGVSVVIPTLFRPEDLRRCLDGLQRQLDPPRQIIVVHRQGDIATAALLASRGETLTIGIVEEEGVIAAMICGLDLVTSTLVAFTDDDAVPHANWTRALKATFENDDVVGVGGRDVLFDIDGNVRPTSLTTSVGTISSVGRVTGNHHRGTGPARTVALLKGVNCCYRTELVALPLGLEGSGAQVHFEVAVGIWLARHGSLIYDPTIAVDHTPAPRFDDDGRDGASARATQAAVTNLALALRESSWSLLLRRTLYQLLIGDRSAPGLGRALVGALDPRDHVTARRLTPATRGLFRAWGRLLRGERLSPRRHRLVQGEIRRL